MTAARAYRYLKPPRHPISQVERARAHASLAGLEDVSLRTQDGLALAGWFAPGRLRSAVVFVHGLGANRMQLLPEAEIAARRGHGVLLYDSRGSGDSEGRTVTWGDRERRDVSAAVDFLEHRSDVNPERIAAYGFSVGATTVALSAADDSRIRAVILGPVWTSLSDELDAKLRRWGFGVPWLAKRLFELGGVDVRAVRPVEFVARIAPRPLLLMSGDEDPDTPPAVMDRIQAAAPFAERWLVPHAGHGEFDKVSPAELDRRFGGFLDASIGAPRPSR